MAKFTMRFEVYGKICGAPFKAMGKWPNFQPYKIKPLDLRFEFIY